MAGYLFGSIVGPTGHLTLKARKEHAMPRGVEGIKEWILTGEGKVVLGERIGKTTVVQVMRALQANANADVFDRAMRVAEVAGTNSNTAAEKTALALAALHRRGAVSSTNEARFKTAISTLRAGKFGQEFDGLTRIVGMTRPLTPATTSSD